MAIVPWNSAQTRTTLAPRAIGKLNRTGGPTIQSRRSKNCSIVFSHREYFTDVVSSGNQFLSVISFAINPGRQNVFPMLQSVALSFETYRFNRLSFEYIPRCSTASTGSFGMMIDFDASDAPAASEREVLAVQGAVDCSVWQNVIYHAPKDALTGLGPRRFTRSGLIPTNSDVKLYDVGTFQYFAYGPGGGTALGKLWVDYEIELYTPQLATELIVYGNSNHTEAGGTISTADGWGTAFTLAGGLPLSVSGNNVEFLTTGEYIVHALSTGTGVTASPAITAIGSATVTLLDALVSGTTSVMYEFLIEVAEVAAGFHFNYAGAFTTLTAQHMDVAPYVLSI
jgi:hypothetical protein